MPEMVTRQQTATPKNPSDDYNWGSEPWVHEHGPTDLDMNIALMIVTALAVPVSGSAQDDEDELVFRLLRPDLMERVWKVPKASSIVRNRVVQAMAQCLKMTREQWSKKYGIAEAKGAQREASA